jgi:SAM-dependent methyltransferase
MEVDRRRNRNCYSPVDGLAPFDGPPSADALVTALALIREPRNLQLWPGSPTYVPLWRCSPTCSTPTGGGPVVDVGCGPGYVTAHLHKLGVDAFGIDLSPAMIDVAQRAHLYLRFEVGSMTDLHLADASIAALRASGR